VSDPKKIEELNNEAMILQRLAKIEADVEWLKEKSENLEQHIWYTIAGIIIVFLMQIVLKII
jgi:hypothetical protein